MDLLECYSSKEDIGGRVSANTKRFLNMFERFNPLPPGLQSRKDELEKKLDTSVERKRQN